MKQIHKEESNYMHRILQVAIANDRGGLTGYIVNNYRRIDREQFQFDFVTYDDSLDISSELESMGASVFFLPRPSHIWSYYKALKSINRQKNYTAIHYNLSYANIVPIVLAKIAGFKRIIVHSHSTGIDDPATFIRLIKLGIHYIGKNLIPFLSSDYFACSKLAAQWMFPKSIMKNNKYEILYNAIELSKFRFDKEKRELLRKKLTIDDNLFVVGHIGRFTYQKNHEFLLDVFREIEKVQPESVLLLIGDGPNRTEIEERAKAYGIFDKIYFLGQRDDVADLYQAMDVLVLPSRFEGLCIVAIEAQMAGLPCICSNKLSEETCVTHEYASLSLEQSAKKWAEKVLEMRKHTRKDNTDVLRAAGYDANIEIKRIEDLYKL